MTVQRKTPKRTAAGSATISLPDLEQLLRGVKPEAMKEPRLLRMRVIIDRQHVLERVIRLQPWHREYVDLYGDGRCRIEIEEAEPHR